MNGIPENIVFDLGGVVLRWEPIKLIARFFNDPVLREQISRDVVGHPDWLDLDRGTLGHDEAAQRFSRRLGIEEEETRAMLEAVPESLVPIPETLDIIHRLNNAGTPLFILSNIGHWTLERLLEAHDFWDIFQGCIFSCEVGMIKPEPEIYRHLLDAYDLVPEETLFIDDLDVNTRAAEALGIRTIQFFDPVQCEQELIDMGALQSPGEQEIA